MFFYYLPYVANLQDWRSLGRADQIEGDPIKLLAGPDISPDGSSGTIFHRYPGPTLPKPIKWQQVGDDYWVGYHASHKPGPRDLERGLRTVKGATVKLLDGRGWIVPVVLPCTDRDPKRKHGLPVLLKLDQDGKTMGHQVPDEYAGLVTDAEAALDAANGGSEDYTHTTVGQYAVKLLGVGYRLGAPEISLLELLDADTACACAMASIDWAERVESALGEVVNG